MTHAPSPASTGCAGVVRPRWRPALGQALVGTAHLMSCGRFALSPLALPKGRLRCPLWRRRGLAARRRQGGFWERRNRGRRGDARAVLALAACGARRAPRRAAGRVGALPMRRASDSASSASCGAAGGRGAQGERLMLGPRGAQVTAPQRALLEGVMARMERVDVWILMNGGGGGVNPFQARAEPCRVRAFSVAGPGRARASVPAQAHPRLRGSARVCADTGRCRRYPAR